MEENELTVSEGTELLPDEIRFRIEQKENLKKKKKISLYFIFTVSAFALALIFSIADIGVRVLRQGSENIPAVLFSPYAEDDSEQNNETLSEFLTSKMFGVGVARAHNLFIKNINTERDELVHTGKEDDENSGEEISADTSCSIAEDEVKTPAYEALKDEEEKKKYPIVSMDLSRGTADKYYIGNETGYAPNIEALLKYDEAVPAFAKIGDTKEPLVLIIHTHGTESYSEKDSNYYIDDGGELWRTHDKDKNVVAIGRIMSEILNESGVPTLHCETMHDKDSYQDSYVNAAKTIKNYLSEFPSIKYVFDIHRDAILKSDGTLVKAVTEVGGKKVAQVMTVVGSNYKGANFPDWERHLALALKLKEKIDMVDDSISRPVYLRGAAYNQQYTPGSLLIEIGSGGNSFEEAANAAEIVANALADMILK